MTRLIGVYGASGCGRGIMPLLRIQYPSSLLVFVDDGLSPGLVNGHEIIDWPNFLLTESSEKAISIAIASSNTRQFLAERCMAEGIPLVEARADSVVQMDNVSIGEGCCLSPFVTLTSNIRIGRCVHINLYTYVEHDCRIDDYVTIAPGAKINGNVNIGAHAYIGSGAVIKQGITIGAHAVIGMGSVVIRDVAPNVTVVGNPARPLDHR